MPGRPPEIYNPTTAILGSPALAAETIVAQLGGIDTLDASSVVILNGQCNFTVGTTGNAARLRIRQTGVAGTVVGDTGAVTGGVVAAAIISLDILGVDSPGVQAGMAYVLTLQVTAATAGSAVSGVVLTAQVS